ncbi:MAG TPA: alpha/beta hydrolase, partial [Acidimicrobiia bacterium]|nr:alpha/beta hydrolase [Acidimicrobiia bacterium]
MPNTTANGLILEYDTTGSPADPPLLLVMGLGAQLITWPDGFCRALADRGFFVVRYDNRDAGLSSRIEAAGVPDLAAVMTGTADAPYHVSDMAADGIGLLDALGIAAAHVVGASMGGMIAQHMAFEYPDRVLSLCSIMSAPTGTMAADPPTPEAGAALLRPAPTTREEAIEAGVEGARTIGSPGFPFDEAKARDRAAASYDRAFYPLGIIRQFAAVTATGDWTSKLAGVKAPTLIIHGGADPLVRPGWGRRTAEAIPGATLLTIP